MVGGWVVVVVVVGGGVWGCGVGGGRKPWKLRGKCVRMPIAVET